MDDDKSVSEAAWRIPTHRPESRAGIERAVKAVVRCEDEARGDQAEEGQGRSKV